MNSSINISELSTGGGCGCKFPEAELVGLLSVLGDSSRDWLHEDAACIDLDGSRFLASTDFIQPIIDDESLFGKIAALHAISDFYAKGCRPKSALVIMCWPRELIGISSASLALQGCEEACKEEGVTIIGGHSIDCQNPILGLSLFGSILDGARPIRVDTAQSGDIIFLTKPLGIGLVANAIRRGVAHPESVAEFASVAATSNKIGAMLADEGLVSSMTDVTGYGLSGQLDKICNHGRLRLEMSFANVPRLLYLSDYLAEGLETKLGKDNRKRTTRIFSEIDDYSCAVLSDPQTNGGLLFTARPSNACRVDELFDRCGEQLWRIGSLV